MCKIESCSFEFENKNRHAHDQELKGILKSNFFRDYHRTKLHFRKTKKTKFTEGFHPSFICKLDKKIRKNTVGIRN